MVHDCRKKWHTCIWLVMLWPCWYSSMAQTNWKYIIYTVKKRYNLHSNLLACNFATWSEIPVSLKGALGLLFCSALLLILLHLLHYIWELSSRLLMGSRLWHLHSKLHTEVPCCSICIQTELFAECCCITILNDPMEVVQCLFVTNKSFTLRFGVNNYWRWPQVLQRFLSLRFGCFGAWSQSTHQPLLSC